MKIQDVFFITLLLFSLRYRKYWVLPVAGFFCLGLSMILYQFWVFFTAQRLVMYAAGYFFFYLLFSLKHSVTVE